MPSAALPSAPIAVAGRAHLDSMSDGDAGVASSLEHVRPVDAFPRHLSRRVAAGGSVGADDSAADCPFRLLPGEHVLVHGDLLPHSQLFVTNYRLFATFDRRKSFCSVPLATIESVEIRDLFFLVLSCKDGKTFKMGSENSENCATWLAQLNASLAAISLRRPDELSVFAFAFHAYCVEERLQHSLSLHSLDTYTTGGELDAATRDFRRLQFDPALWRVTDVNAKFQLCDSYPSSWIAPACVTDAQLAEASRGRYLRRVPAVVWRQRRTGAVLMRSSQPAVGFFGWRNPSDERLLEAALDAADRDHPVDAAPSAEVKRQSMLIVDARSYTAAWANRAKGGGFENPEYYDRCEVQFMALGNIHNIRYSFQQLRLLIWSSADTASWLTALQNTQWMQYLCSVQSAAVRVAEAMCAGRSVLVHCSDGWDRTAQIVSLAKLLLDPHYRTIRGFKELVEREWLQFGHKFADRCGLGVADANERSPVFLQWLDCVHQLQQQQPCAFEFTQLYLVKLAQHVYSGLFGTFLHNSDSTRQSLAASTFSVWAYLHPDNEQWRNVIFEPLDGVLLPPPRPPHLRLWHEVYCFGDELTEANRRAAATDTSLPRSAAATLDRSLTRAHSCDSLASAGEMSAGGASAPSLAVAAAATMMRTGSDPSLTLLHAGAAYHRASAPTPSVDDVSGLLDEMLSSVSGKSVAERNSTPELNGRRPVVNGRARAFTEGYAAPTTMSSTFTVEPIEECVPEAPLLVESDCVDCGVDLCAPNEMRTSTSEISDSVVMRPTVHRSSQQPTLNGYKVASPRQDEAQSRRRKKQLPLTVDGRVDCDGLTTIADPIQERMRERERQHLHDKEQLDAEVQRLRALIRCQNSLAACQKWTDKTWSSNGCFDGTETGALEPSSLESNGASDVSWEALDEGDALPTKWIPDHAVTHCMGCDAAFWAINRKHHCRSIAAAACVRERRRRFSSCGKVFCSACSAFEHAVPAEQLYGAVRVCRGCFMALRRVSDAPVAAPAHIVPPPGTCIGRVPA